MEALREVDELEVDAKRLEAPNESLPAKGSLTFRVTWSPDPSQKLPRYPKKEGEERMQSGGILRIHLMRANDILAADCNGKSDPYVHLRIHGIARQSRKIKGTFKSREQALNPVWDETIDFRGTLRSFVTDSLTLTLKD